VARASVSLGQAPGQYSPAWATGFIQKLTEALNLTQKTNEEFEPPHAIGAASRMVLADTNGVRYAVTVSTAGALVVTAL
jgi:hypothetical protein